LPYGALPYGRRRSISATLIILPLAAAPPPSAHAAETVTLGRVLLRPSGVKPLVRVVAQAADIERARSVAGRLAVVVSCVADTSRQ
jgi:phosphomannomutase